MDTKELSKYFGIVITTLLLSVGITTLIDEDKPVYSCESKGIVSDCVNGVKACNEDTGICTRCYYDVNNGRAYSYCSEGWQENFITKEPIINPNTGYREGSYKCDIIECDV